MDLSSALSDYKLGPGTSDCPDIMYISHPMQQSKGDAGVILWLTYCLMIFPFRIATRSKEGDKVRTILRCLRRNAGCSCSIVAYFLKPLEHMNSENMIIPSNWQIVPSSSVKVGKTSICRETAPHKFITELGSSDIQSKDKSCNFSEEGFAKYSFRSLIRFLQKNLIQNPQDVAREMCGLDKLSDKLK